jgi:hypothetical protein
MADTALIDFCAKVAADLGMTLDSAWDPANVSFRITDGMGKGYSFIPVRGSTDRVEISAVFPPTRYWFTDGDRKRITASRARGPEAVAADITRRLAPRYAEVLAECNRWDAIREADDIARLSLARAIAAVFPAGVVSWPSHLQTDQQTQLLFHGPNHFGGHVRLQFAAPDAEITLRVPRSVVVAMLALFAAVCEPR